MNNYHQQHQHPDQQQQPSSEVAMMANYSCSGGGTSITTDLIQKYLDENKQLILAILENQRLGKLNECATYQAKLQNNLMYLAAIADAQHQAPSPMMQVRTANPMQLQHHDHGQQVPYTLHQQQQQPIQMMHPSILGQRNNMASLPAYMQPASGTQTHLHHSSTPHHHQQFLHAAAPNSGYITGTCNTLQFNMQAAETGMVNAGSFNVSSGNYHDLISHGDLTYSSNVHTNMSLNGNRSHRDHHTAGANTTIDQGDSESAGQDSESASYLNVPDDQDH